MQLKNYHYAAMAYPPGKGHHRPKGRVAINSLANHNHIFALSEQERCCWRFTLVTEASFNCSQAMQQAT